MIKINTGIDNIDNKQLEDLLKKSSTSSFFQSTTYFNFIQNLNFLEPFIISVLDDNILSGVIVGYIQKDGDRLKQFFSRRAIINGGPLLRDDISPEALKALLNGCRKFLKGKTIYIESRNFFDYSRYKKDFKSAKYDFEPHYNFQINTASEVIMMQNMGKSRKRDVKVSLRDGASIIERPTEKEICDFYKILNDLYTQKVKTPLFPLDFFQELNKKEWGKIFLIKYNEEIVGGTVCVGTEGSPLYEWFACGKDGEYKNIHASTLATFAGIQYASTHNHPCFDMMGAGKPNDGGYGVRDFKAKFGGTLVEHGRFVHICNPILYNIGKIGIKILKKF